jgi:hypothetical protein
MVVPWVVLMIESRGNGMAWSMEEVGTVFLFFDKQTL